MDMEVNLPVIVFGILAAIVLIAYLVYRNLKDKKELEDEMDAVPDKKEFHSRIEDEEKM
jgi:uncharacterized membrane protein YebE (DUF533 family)